MILIMGPSGSGKSSQAAMLARQNSQLVKIEIGEMLRASQEPEMKSILESGELVSDKLVIKLIRNSLQKLSPLQEPVLDGFPRRLSQVAMLDELLDELNMDIRAALVLQVSQTTALARLGQRGRHDDTAAAIKRKWQLYRKQTRQVVEHYQSAGLAREVDGEGTVEAVAQRIDAVIKSLE